MLSALYLRDFVIVEQLALDFSAGFTVFSGETGAGKSILIDALTLSLGARAGAEWVREGAKRAEVTTVWQVDSADSALFAWLQQQDISAEEELVCRRVIDDSGRSRAFLNGTLITLTQLREVAEFLVSIHGQHAHQALMKAETQRTLLDRHGGLQPLAEQVATYFQQWQHLQAQLESYQNQAKQYQLEREHLEWQEQELSLLAPQEGEWDEVQKEHSRLSHAQDLLQAVGVVAHQLSEGDDNIRNQLNALSTQLKNASALDSAVQPMFDTVQSLVISVEELSHDLLRYSEGVVHDPEQLAEVERRVQALHDAARKFQRPVNELSTLQQEVSDKLQSLAQLADIDGLQQQVATAQQNYTTAAQQLSAERARVGKELSQQVTQSMQTLHMSGGVFAVQLSPIEPSAHGAERVVFAVSGHSAMSPKPLAKVASGGELSRISLALSVITAQATSTATLVFDEVDSGIGGGVAETVGALLKTLGKVRQVFCITHLAQVASQGTQHFLVAKDTKGEAPKTQVTLLDETARVNEIARMVGGIEITATTLAHAKEALKKSL